MVELYIDEQRNIHYFYMATSKQEVVTSETVKNVATLSDCYSYIYEHAYAIGPLINNETHMLSTEFNIVCSLTCKHFRFRRRHADFCTMRAYFDVGLCTNRLGVIENLGVAVGIASISCSQPNL